MDNVIDFPRRNTRSTTDHVSFMAATSLEEVLGLVAGMADADQLMALSISALARDGHVLHIEVEVAGTIAPDPLPEPA